MSEPMDAYIAVFNYHVGEARDRTRRVMSWAAPEALAEVDAIERDGGGIMAIFDQPPTEATRRYVYLVWAFVNEALMARVDPASDPAPNNAEESADG